MNKLYPRISTRLTLPFLIVILIMGSVSVFVVTRLVAGSIEERIANQLRSSAQSVSNSTIEVERQYLAALRLIAFTEGVSSSILTNDIETLQNRVNSIALNDSLNDTMIINADRQVLLRATLTNSDEVNATASVPDVSSWRIVQRILSGQADALGDKFIEIQDVNGDIFIYFAAPIRDENNVIIAAVLSGIRADRFIEYVRSQSLSDVTLYQSNGDVIGTSITRENSEFASPQIVAQLNTQVNRALQITDTTINDLSYEVLYAPFVLRETQVGVLEVALQTDFVVEQISVSRDSIALLFMALMTSVAIMGLMIARSITNPVAKMVSTTRLIRLGDLEQRVDLKTRDELGELAESFDSMTENLLQRNQRIEKMYKHQQRENAQRDAILKSIGDAVIVLNKTGKSILSNSAAKQLVTEIKKDNAEYKRFKRLMSEPKALQSSQSVSFCKQYYSVLATPVILRSGYFVGYVVVLRDITELIEAEQLKDDLIKQLSHELRTPLSAAIGYAQLVEMFAQDVMTDQSKDYMAKTLSQLNTLSSMVNQVISVSSMLSDNLTLELDGVDLVDIVEDAIETQRELANKSDITIIYKSPVNQLCVDAESERLKEAIVEVINNAITYSLTGGSIRVSLGQTTVANIVHIIDHGVGIALHDQPKVFDRLYRGESADAGITDNRGLGVGLFIAKTIVEAHHGQIRLKSKHGKGTRVSIALPRKTS